MKTPLSTRRARREDFPRLVELWREMMDFHTGLDPRFQTAPAGREAYLQFLEETSRQLDAAIFVAEREDRLLGYTIASILVNPAIYALPQYGYISEMAVDEASRGAGVGHALWQAAAEWLGRRGLTVVQLNVSPLNERGQKFWRGLGFRDFLEILWCDIAGK